MRRYTIVKDSERFSTFLVVKREALVGKVRYVDEMS